MKLKTALACGIVLSTSMAGIYMSSADQKEHKTVVTSAASTKSKASLEKVTSPSTTTTSSSSTTSADKAAANTNNLDNIIEVKQTNVPANGQVTKEPKPFQPLIAQYAKEYNVPVKLANAVIHTESNYNPLAHGKAGEIGLMQLMPTTARSLGYKGPLNNLYNPRVNISYGMRYLSEACKLGKGDLCHTILKYNAGFGAKHMNPISARYCMQVKDFLANA